MMARSAWITGLAVIGLTGLLVGCNGKGTVQEPSRHMPNLPDVNGSDGLGVNGRMRSECPGAGYRGRLRRDLTQPYSSRAYLLDDGSLCRPAP